MMKEQAAPAEEAFTVFCPDESTVIVRKRLANGHSAEIQVLAENDVLRVAIAGRSSTWIDGRGYLRATIEPMRRPVRRRP